MSYLDILIISLHNLTYPLYFKDLVNNVYPNQYSSIIHKENAYIKQSSDLFTIQQLAILPANLNYNTTSGYTPYNLSFQIISGIFLVCFIVQMHHGLFKC